MTCFIVNLVELKISQALDLQPWTGQMIIQVLRRAHVSSLVKIHCESKSSSISISSSSVQDNTANARGAVSCGEKVKTKVSSHTAVVSSHFISAKLS